MVKLQLWDTAGQERFRTVTSTYYRGAQGIVVIFDVTERRSFESVRAWMEDVEKWASPGTEKILVGNKTDLHESRKVTTEEGEQLAEELRMPYFETSARENYNVEESFMALASEIKKNAPHRFQQTGATGAIGISTSQPEAGMCGSCGGTAAAAGESAKTKMQSMQVSSAAENGEESVVGGALSSLKKLVPKSRFEDGDDMIKRDKGART